jgi:hypothetical protein
MISRGVGFLAVVLLGSSPIPFPSPSCSKFNRRHTRRLEKERQLADGRGRGKRVGEEPNHTIARKPGSL